jgi:recombination protein RecA
MKSSDFRLLIAIAIRSYSLAKIERKSMAHPAVAVLESALRARKLDRTLTTTLPSWEWTDPSSLLPTDIPLVDACLRGGLPRGQLSELTGACSSGRMTLLLQLMAAATRRGEIAALVDTLDCFDVASAAAAGVDLDRLLWIRGSDSGLGTRDSGTQHTRTQNVRSRNMESRIPDRESRIPSSVDRAIDRALKALNLVLQAGGFGIVAIDLADVPAVTLRQIPFTTWPRVQRVIEGSDTACVLVTPEPLARSAGGLTLSLTSRSTWAGMSDRSHVLQGIDLRVRVVSPRKRIDGDVRVRASM